MARLRTDLLDKRLLVMLLETSKILICMILVSGQPLTPLAHGFKQENGGGLRDIQGIDLASHGDADGALTAPDWTHTSVLSTHDQRTGEAQIKLSIALAG